MSTASETTGDVPSRAGRGLSVAAAIALLLLCAGATRAAEPPNLSGTWKLSRALSDDIEAKVKDAAGSEYMQGGTSWAAETVLPWGRKFSEGERVSLRDALLGAVQALARVEVEQTASEVRTIHGEEGVRVFYLQRAGTGSNILTGETVKRTAHWKGAELVLESAGSKSKANETLTLVPARNQLVHLLRIEMPLLKHPIDLRLVYDRASQP